MVPVGGIPDSDNWRDWPGVGHCVSSVRVTRPSIPDEDDPGRHPGEACGIPDAEEGEEVHRVASRVRRSGHLPGLGPQDEMGGHNYWDRNPPTGDFPVAGDPTDGDPLLHTERNRAFGRNPAGPSCRRAVRDGWVLPGRRGRGWVHRIGGDRVPVVRRPRA